MSSLTLPETVTVLDCPNGSKVYIVGTAHFSKESIEDVRTTIQKVILIRTHSTCILYMYIRDRKALSIVLTIGSDTRHICLDCNEQALEIVPDPL